jgi:uncharacterized GH25 family protein
VYTLSIASTAPWVTDESGWHRGVKRDFATVKTSAVYVMAAKRIICKDGKNPGEVMHAVLDMLPEKAKLTVGEDAVIKVLYEGKPLPNVKVICYREGASEFEEYKADSEGVLRYPVTGKGLHAFIARYVDENKSVDDEFDETSYKITLTLETD